MSQHDFSIANQTASSARGDINNALQALASNNSGTGAPSTTYANMLWYETDTNRLKMRNEGNTAWLDLGYIDQTDGLEILDNTKVVNTSGTQKGILGDQSTATWQAGTSTTSSLVSPAAIKAAILSTVRVWRSSDINSWSNGGSYTISHGLGVSPLSVMYEFICTTADRGAVVGDVITLTGGERYANWGIQTTDTSSTQLSYAFYTAGMVFRDKTNSSSHSRYPANWKMRVCLLG